MSTDIQEKIAAARREAETLKEKIRAKRDQLADTTREYFHPVQLMSHPDNSSNTPRFSSGNGCRD